VATAAETISDRVAGTGTAVLSIAA
jgi:hypothetical protein